MRKCPWEIAVRNPYGTDSEWFEAHACQTCADARELAMSILAAYPWIITSVRPRTALSSNL